VIEVYAITDDPTPPEPPLRAVRSDGLTAIVAPAGEREVTPDALWRHEELIESLMERRDLLPVRFGTLVSDERAAAQAVAEGRERLAAALDRVRGAVELAVRAHPHEPPERERERGESGRDYMRARSRRLQVARLVHQALADAARDSVEKPGPELLRAAYLVERDAVAGFVSVVLRLQRSHPELDVLCTGPWPPYSFADGSASS
jgi:Gas vesicle synthesis protein GvpL/GvpF